MDACRVVVRLLYVSDVWIPGQRPSQPVIQPKRWLRIAAALLIVVANFTSSAGAHALLHAHGFGASHEIAVEPSAGSSVDRNNGSSHSSLDAHSWTVCALCGLLAGGTALCEGRAVALHAAETAARTMHSPEDVLAPTARDWAPAASRAPPSALR